VIGRGRDTVVVHIVWAPFGPEMLARFVESYIDHAPGSEHRLLMVFNGFGQNDDLTPWRHLIADLRYEELRLASPVVDLAAYRKAAELVPAERYCFVNSSTVIRTEGWLGLLASAAARERVGAVGATGSWASKASGARNSFGHGLGGPYRHLFADREATRRAFSKLAAHAPEAGAGPVGPWRRKIGTAYDKLVTAYRLVPSSAAFASFPSPHLRTSCFLIERDLWLRVCRREPHSKEAAYRIESGRRGMTPRLTAMGLRVLVVGRDGRAYETSEWPASRTLWQGNQENLLVEDNQTRDYQEGDADLRRALSCYAWGFQADPTDG
jgi:hypothetical protein